MFHWTPCNVIFQRTEILEKSCRMRQCTQTREKNIRATMSANEQHFRAPTRTCAPYPRNLVSNKPSFLTRARFWLVYRWFFVFLCNLLDHKCLSRENDVSAGRTLPDKIVTLQDFILSNILSITLHDRTFS